MGNKESRSEMGDSWSGGPIQTAEIHSSIKELVQQDQVVIFSKTTCPFCYDAKEVFDKMGQKYTVIELNKHPQGTAVQDVLKDMTGARTVPRVFVGGKCIGGGSDTVSMYNSGTLEKMLCNGGKSE